jgi:hypothetical protein
MPVAVTHLARQRGIFGDANLPSLASNLADRVLADVVGSLKCDGDHVQILGEKP